MPLVPQLCDKARNTILQAYGYLAFACPTAVGQEDNNLLVYSAKRS